METLMDADAEDLLAEIEAVISSRRLPPLRPGDITAPMLSVKLGKGRGVCTDILKGLAREGLYETELVQDDRGYKVRAYRRKSNAA